MELGISEPLVFGEVEINPKLFKIFGFSCLNFFKVFQQRLISLFDLLAKNITVCEDLKPKLSDLFFSEIIVFKFLFLFSQQISNLLEVNVSIIVLSLNDVVDLCGQFV